MNTKVTRIESRESSTIKSYRDLVVWQKSRILVKETYLLLRSFPKEEIYGLTSQIKRCVVSIPSNIAEGSSRRSTAEFLRFINIATGSLAEFETQLTLASDLGFISEKELAGKLKQADEISRMLQGLYNSLTTRLSTLDSKH